METDGDSIAQYKDYTLIREIGRGAYGVVYLAQKDGVLVALKKIECRENADSNELRRERHGVETLMRLPPIDGMIKIYDCGNGDDDGSFYYTMDLADDELGGRPDSDHYRPKSLSSVASAEIALPLPECVKIAIRLSQALRELHKAHIVHRDIKPGNILFVKGKATLADPGLIADEREANSIVGTPGYAPPERCGSPEGDIFGLGLTFYRISTGRSPEEIGLPPCAEADFDHPCFWKWMMILSRAMDQQPSRRYHSAKSLLADMRKLNGMIYAARGGWLRRTANLAIAAVVAAIVIPLVVNYAIFYAWQSNDDWVRSHVDPPFPYSCLKRFYMPKDPSQVKSPLVDLDNEIASLKKEIYDITNEVSAATAKPELAPVNNEPEYRYITNKTTGKVTRQVLKTLGRVVSVECFVDAPEEEEEKAGEPQR